MTTTRTRPIPRFRLAAATLTAVFAATAMILGGASTALAGPMPEVDVRDVAVDTTVPEQATVSFDYFADYPEEWATPGRSLLTVSIDGPTGSAFHEEIPITAVSGSWSRAIPLPAGQYELTISGFEFNPSGTFTIPVYTGSFDVNAGASPTPTPTPTTTPTETPVPTPTATAKALNGSLTPRTAAAEGTITVVANGFVANEALEFWLHSTPIKLTTGTASVDGTVSQTLTIPESAPAGAHRIEIRGATSGSLFLDLTIVKGLAATGPDSATTTGFGIGAATIIVLGVVGLLISRRLHGRRAASHSVQSHRQH